MVPVQHRPAWPGRCIEHAMASFRGGCNPPSCGGQQRGGGWVARELALRRQLARDRQETLLVGVVCGVDGGAGCDEGDCGQDCEAGQDKAALALGPPGRSRGCRDEGFWGGARRGETVGVTTPSGLRVTYCQ